MIRCMNRRVPFGIAVPAAGTASFLAHAFAPAPGGGPVDADGLEHASAAGPGLAPLLIGIAAAALVLAVAGRFRRREPGGSAAWFAAFPALAYVLQEVAERALHAQLFPFPLGLEPGTALVLVVHAAFGLGMFLLVRALQVVVRRTLSGSGSAVTPVRDAPASPITQVDAAPRWLPLVRDGPIRAPPLSVPA